MRRLRHIPRIRELESLWGLALLLVTLVTAGFAASAMAEDDGGGGSAAAGILNGIAADISAAAPIGVAAIQAAADRSIARIQADGAVQMTQITADTTKYLADIQTNIAKYQAYTARDINEINQEGQTRRLDDQLAELRAARQDALQADRERLYYENILNQEQIALAQKQAADNLKLARMTLKAQLTQAGFSSGFVNVDSGSRLSVSRLTGSGAGFRSVARGIAQTSLPKLQTASGRLMSSLHHHSHFSTVHRGRSSRGLILQGSTVGGQIYRSLGLAAGSFRDERHRPQFSSVPVSDLASFQAAVQMGTTGAPASFVGGEGAVSVGGESQAGSSLSGGSHNGSVNVSDAGVGDFLNSAPQGHQLRSQ